VRPYTSRGPVWRCADQVQFNMASAKLDDDLLLFLASTSPISLPLPFLDLPHADAPTLGLGRQAAASADP
jgi:hypothetical protein